MSRNRRTLDPNEVAKGLIIAKRSITTYLFTGKPDVLRIKLRSREPVVSIGGGGLYVGRTPGRFAPALGHSSSKDLSIQRALELLGANDAAQRMFPLAATPGSHWIYFALFSSCKKNPGVRPLKTYINFLADGLGRRNAGVARRLLANGYSARKLERLVERSRGVHDIRRRIKDEAERRLVISEDVIVRLDKLVRSGRRSNKNFKLLAQEFRRSWCRQSKVLREQNNHVLV